MPDRSAVLEGDPVDIALDWAASEDAPGSVPVISMANEHRAGGDWESGLYSRVCSLSLYTHRL